MAFVAYELFYRDDRVAVIVHDQVTQEIDVALPTPGTPSAPAWMEYEDLERVVEQLSVIVEAGDDKTIQFNEPDDPAFTLRESSPFEAKDLSEATYTFTNDAGETMLFQAFAIEFRPNLKSPSAFPVAVFAVDPRVGRLVGHVYGPENPFAPRGYNRKQQKLVGKHLDGIFEKIAKARLTGQVVSPFKNMGPQLRSEGLPAVEAVDIHHALDQAVSFLERYYSQRAS